MALPYRLTLKVELTPSSKSDVDTSLWLCEHDAEVRAYLQSIVPILEIVDKLKSKLRDMGFPEHPSPRERISIDAVS